MSADETTLAPILAFVAIICGGIWCGRWAADALIANSIDPDAHAKVEAERQAKIEEEHITSVISDLLETDALTPNDGETLHPDYYTVHAEDVEYLVRTVLTLAGGAA